ncbi:MAG: glycosyltransferase [Chitinophagales bacterium]|jgi:cellulose synthase/poly-beta-1,6-N-acetylglucosamine synthase-like glycosyltransferase
MKNLTPQKIIRVSVGLSLFNEANNIAGVLRGILSQKPHGWELNEILLYNDGSTDATIQEIKKVKSPLIKLINDGNRKGKTFRLSQMFQDFSGDLLLMFDGDISFVGTDVITRMAESFDDPKVMLVGGNSTPFPPRNFFQKCVNTTFDVFYRSRKYIKDGNNIFGCTGSILGIRNILAKKITLPEIINEDAYIYLYCMSTGYAFAYQDNAKVLYMLPTNLRDYLRQAFRSHPEAVEIELKKYFGELVDKEFHRPLKFYVKSVLITFLKHPVEVISMVVIHMLCKPFYSIISSRYKLSWFTATSTH